MSEDTEKMSSLEATVRRRAVEKYKAKFQDATRKFLLAAGSDSEWITNPWTDNTETHSLSYYLDTLIEKTVAHHEKSVGDAAVRAFLQEIEVLKEDLEALKQRTDDL